MDLSIKTILAVLALVSFSSVFGSENELMSITEVVFSELAPEKLTVSKAESIESISTFNRPERPAYAQSYSRGYYQGRTRFEDPEPDTDPTDRVGRIIANGRELVALGEDVYALVTKGRPSNTTSYAPISVVPKVDGEPVDVLDTEGFSVPVRRSAQVVYKNGYGMEVVVFKFSIIYSYNGTYNNKGAYLTAVQIVPDSVRTLFGFDFTATMKLGGLQNVGTKLNPIAGATLLMQHSVSSVIVSHTQTHTFFVDGKGKFKKI